MNYKKIQMCHAVDIEIPSARGRFFCDRQGVIGAAKFELFKRSLMVPADDIA
ncbi:hypothetical protein J7430_14060 [Xanthomonas axonopodis pv. begoniae]|nr:hypothetical protein [Xanthomonas axonopodis pv. begoniae]